MILDFNSSSKLFFVRVPRREVELVQSLVREHGLDFSSTSSTRNEAVLFTSEPYAAVAFYGDGTARAQEQLVHIKREVDASWVAESGAHIDMPPGKELWGFQKAGVEYAMRHGNALIGDEPGLGKTMTAICIANEMRAKKVLVLCPASIRLQWVKRIREWTTMKWPLIIHPILSSRNGVHPDANWTIVSYDLASGGGIGRGLAEGSYDLVILDEGHYLKTVDSKRTRAVFGGGRGGIDPLAERAGAIISLTGTPLPNRPREAYTLARGLCWDSIDWMSEDKFRERYNPSAMREVTDRDGNVKMYVDERSGRHAELQSRLRANFMVRHLKREVMTQLKMPIYDLIQVEETRAVKQALAAESLLDIDPETLQGADGTFGGNFAEARHMMGIAIAPQVVEYVKMLLVGGETKLTLFGWHIDVLDILENGLHKYGVLRIDGRTSATQKPRLVQQFINDPRPQIMLGNIQSMGVGTDELQLISCHALIAEPSVVPGDNVQAFDRLDRGGQTRTVQGEIFVAPNSIMERVLAHALRKLSTTHKALDRRTA